MKNIILHWQPVPGPDQILNVQIELGMQHPKRNKTPYLALLKVSKDSAHMTASPGFASLPELTEKERETIIEYSRVYWLAHFNAGSCTTIWLEDNDATD